MLSTQHRQVKVTNDHENPAKTDSRAAGVLQARPHLCPHCPPFSIPHRDSLNLVGPTAKPETKLPHPGNAGPIAGLPDSTHGGCTALAGLAANHPQSTGQADGALGATLHDARTQTTRQTPHVLHLTPNPNRKTQMQNTHTKTNQPAAMSPAWCAGVDTALNEILAFLRRPGNPTTTTAVGRIMTAANNAGNQPAHGGMKQTWTGEASLRLWGSTCTELRGLLRPDKHGRKPMLRVDDVDLLAQLSLRLLEIAARLYAEVAPALGGSVIVGNKGEVEARLKLQEFILNYTIVPTVIDLHRGFVWRSVDLGEGRECGGEAEKLISLVQQAAEFADRLCKLSEQYAPDSNPYAALVGDGFMADSKRIQALARR